jgi:uncharacterized cupredoxin-like copper-binding protein
MLIAALSTGHKVGLGLVGLAFVVFALLSAFLLPALRPDYPGKRGLPAFLTLSVTLFVGMMFAVFFFGREPSESHAAEGSKATSTTTPSETTTPSTTAPSTRESTTTAPESTTTAPAAPKSVAVTEVEFKIELPSTTLSPGTYTFDLTNKGHVGHDLVFNGPGVDNDKTPVIGPGKTAKLTVDLKSGTYDVYCSVPGHKQAGIAVNLKVS